MAQAVSLQCMTWETPVYFQSDHLSIVVDKVELGMIFLPVRLFNTVSSNTE